MKAPQLVISILLLCINTPIFASESDTNPIQLLTGAASAVWTVGTAAATVGGLVSVSLMAKWGFEEFTGQESSCPFARLRKLEKRSAGFVTKKEVDDVVAQAVGNDPNDEVAAHVPQLFRHTRILSDRTHKLNRRLRRLEMLLNKKQHLPLMGSPKKPDAAAISRRKFVLELAQSLS